MLDLLSIGTNRGHSMIGVGISAGLTGAKRARSIQDPLPALDLDWATDRSLPAAYGPTPSFSRASTGTFFNSSGTLTTAAINAPRFNHVYNGSSWVSKGLLVEEQRTNLVPRSEEFNTAWFKNAISVSSNSLTSPDGQLTADKLIPSATNAFHGLYTYPLTTPSTGLYTVSTYVKSGEYSKPLIMFLFDTSRWAGVQFDLSTGSVLYSASLSYTLSNPSIVPVGGGWYRISVTCNLNSTTNYIGFSVSNNNWTSGSVADFAFTGDGASGAYFWGAQVESGSFPTSYIPTTSAAVTRSADVCQITGSDFTSFWNASEGSFTVEWDSIYDAAQASSRRLFLVQNSDATARLNSEINNGSINWETVPAGANLSAAFTLSANQTVKNSFAYKINDFALVLNGGVVGTDTSVNVPSGLTILNIGNGVSTTHSGHIARLRYYPARLTNAKLQELST